MTTRSLSDRSGEIRIAVAVEMLALSAAAIGLGLGLLAAPGSQTLRGAEPDGHGIRASH